MLRETETRAGEAALRWIRWVVWSPLRLLGALAVVVLICIAAATANAQLTPTSTPTPTPTPSEALPSHWEQWPRTTAGPLAAPASPPSSATSGR